MTATMSYSAPRSSASAEPSSCEISSFAEAARALHMMDRELALLREEHQALLVRFNRARLAAFAGVALGLGGISLALAALLAV